MPPHTHASDVGMLCEGGERLKFYSLLVGMQNGTAILENSVAISFKLNIAYHMIQ